MGQSLVKISEAFKNVSILAIDTAPFIYFVERYVNYFDRVAAIFQLIDDNRFSTFTSVITLTEVLNKPLRDKDNKVVFAYKNLLLAGENLRLIRVTESIAEQAATLRAQYRLRAPDSIQIASALALNCDSFFDK